MITQRFFFKVKVAFAILLTVAGSFFIAPNATYATNYLLDNFDSYSTGNIAGQGGWTLGGGTS